MKPRIVNPLVSVVIPSYNREKTIVRAINSVLCQTYQNFEIIVVDDCSTDNTKKVIKDNFNDPRVIYYRLPINSGACAARNKGIELSKGEYIAFQDSDDEWLCEKLEKQIDVLLGQEEYDGVFCQFIKIDNEKVEIGPDSNIAFDKMQSQILVSNFISTQTLMLKKEIFAKVGLFDAELPRYQDWDLAIRLLNKAKLYYQKEPLAVMYLQSNSISKNKSAQLKALKIILNKHRELFDKNPKEKGRRLRNLAFAYFSDKECENNHKLFKDSFSYFLKSIKYDLYNFSTWLFFVFFLIPIPRTIKMSVFQYLKK